MDWTKITHTALSAIVLWKNTAPLLSPSGKIPPLCYRPLEKYRPLENRAHSLEKYRPLLLPPSGKIAPSPAIALWKNIALSSTALWKNTALFAAISPSGKIPLSGKIPPSLLSPSGKIGPTLWNNTALSSTALWKNTALCYCPLEKYRPLEK